MSSRSLLTLALTALTAAAAAGGAAARPQHPHAHAAPSQAAAARRYACPMHPEETSDTPGRCPRSGCGMRMEERVEKAVTAAPQIEAAAGMTLAEASAKYFPNVELLTQDDRPVRFYDDLLKGKVVLINFMFTTCPGVCPPMTANLAKVQSYLGDRVGKEVAIISISVDPATDTPAALKKYADGFKARPGWYFLTGKKENVDLVLSKLGGYVADKSKHSSVLILGNEATGEWVKGSAMGSPSHIAEAVLELLKSNAGQS